MMVLIKNILLEKLSNFLIILILAINIFNNSINSQSHISADPSQILVLEKDQLKGKLALSSNIFRPIFFNTDTSLVSIKFNIESYFNDNAPNQENMDVRYIKKGYGLFNSLQFSLNSKHLFLILEPYFASSKSYPFTSNVERSSIFSVLNDQNNYVNNISKIRNFLTFFHYKGLGFGYHKGNRWWGPSIHSSLQMTNNTFPIPAQIIGTMKEIKIGNLGFYGLYSFSKLNKETDFNAKYLTSFNAYLTWYGPIIVSLGFSRNYLTGGKNISSYVWTEQDARKIIFEDLLTSNLIDNEYTVGGHDYWDQTLSGYASVILPNRNLKVYAEFGSNDNRMYFADFLSQPDHSMATIIGIRDYGFGKMERWVWGVEWTNLMITYSSRHRISGAGTWYSRPQYNFSSYNGRRWGAHSGSDSDDWYVYAGIITDNLLIIPSLNYERHGIVTHRPAEVKLELKIDFKFKKNNSWFGLMYEKQFEAFLGFPDYFYVDINNNPVNKSKGRLAGSRKINTLVLNFSKNINL